MSASSAAMWLTIACIGVADAVWMSVTGFSLAPQGLVHACMAIGLFVALALFYHATGRSRRLAALAHSAALIAAFFLVAAIASYLTVSTSGTLVDSTLASIDEAMGLSWPQWFWWVRERPILQNTLYVAYGTSGAWLFLGVFYLSLTSRFQTNNELIWSLMLSLIITVPASGLLPAESAWLHYGVENHVDAYHMAHFSGLRAGELRELDLTQTTGLITFPSFHTTLAILAVYAVHQSGRLLIAVAAVNALVLVSVPTEGGHYFIDVIAGAVVGPVAIVLARRLERFLDAFDARRSRGAAAAAEVGERPLVPLFDA